MPWFFAAFTEPPALVNGQLVPPQRPGLGLDIDSDAVEKYAVPVGSD